MGRKKLKPGDKVEVISVSITKTGKTDLDFLVNLSKTSRGKVIAGLAANARNLNEDVEVMK